MKNENKICIHVGMGSCGLAGGAGHVYEALHDELQKRGAEASIRSVGCNGMCFAEPLVEVLGPGEMHLRYGRVTPSVARKIVQRHTATRSLGKRFANGLRDSWDRLTKDAAWIDPCDYLMGSEDKDLSESLKHQVRIVLSRCGADDPTDAEEYERNGGFEALRKVLFESSPEDVIDVVDKSGLRGRGGAGYPSGKKWRLARSSKSDKKYIVCNGDEGDPGAFMDRALLESDPFKVIEGMVIAAYAVGIDEGYFYVRSEYPLAVKRLREVIIAAQQKGWLGKGILGSKFNLDLHVFQSAGAFVCGEETALIASIEGRRGIPRVRPPYPTEEGLWGKPTLVSNVETFACVPWIIHNGADAFSAIGTKDSKGTKVFALAGRIKRGGLVEAPMGMTIGEIVEKIGGGVPNGRKFKAVQIGGPSGGCLPARLADTPIDYEALRETGTIMGSGGLVVLDDSTCMVDFARFFLPFALRESCGKCTFCRIGTQRMLEIVNRICEGKAGPKDIERLEELAETMKTASFCGLGRTTPNPVLTSLRYFREEYEAHLEGRCPAGQCKSLITYSITDKCIGCTLCARNCPVEAIRADPYEQHEIDTEKCVRCGMCKLVCPEDAVTCE